MEPDPVYVFRLYVAGDAPNSAQAAANLAALCRLHLADRYRIDIIDVYQEPRRALADVVFMTPTLLLLGPPPVRRIVGTLSPIQSVLAALNVGQGAA